MTKVADELAARATPRKRVRLTPERRRAQILDVATRLIAQQGYYGMSLQNVADEVGITQAGLLHHVRSKEGLLELLVEQRYDQQGTPADFVATGDPAAVHPDGPSFPAYCRYLVGFNSRRPELIKLYMVLSTEAASPGHPAHEYFATRPTGVWDLYQKTPWRLPPSVGSFQDLHDLVEMCLEAMDGIQVRMFRSPAVDITTEWARFEQVLFPSPVWDDYR